MKYKVGDRVKIREDLIVGNAYGSEIFVKDMEYYKGNMATIIAICGDTYRINIDNDNVQERYWHWTDEMFEENKYHTPKFNVGDKVRVRRDLEVGKQYNGLILNSEMYEHHDIMTIRCIDDDYIYECEENEYYWGEDILEKVDNNNNNTVDIGYYLKYCGHRVIKNVYYGGYAHDHDHVFCTTVDSKNQYTLPVDSIEFIIPHEVN